MKMLSSNMFLILLVLTLSTVFASEEVKHEPTGSVGMQGRKQDSETFTAVQKRAPPLGFHGMRGKKDDAEYQLKTEAFEKRRPTMGFHGMRGKKDEQDLALDNDLFEKRGAGLGFHGMRGKKDQSSDQDLDYVDKRAYQMGFQGVRGKKGGEPNYDPRLFGDADAILVVNDWEDNNIPEYMDMGEDNNNPFGYWQYEDEASLTKRAQKGFFGMRGKKGVSGFYGVRGKKGPPNAFFGVRGKKAPPSGFFGVRGKKAPPMGFQGVRGKKNAEESLNSLLTYLTSADGDYREEISPYSRNGLVGMRMKKDWNGVDAQGPSAEPEATGGGTHEPPAEGSQ